MALIQDEDREVLRQEFEQHLDQPVKLVVFTQEFECEYCTTTRELAEELASITDKISVEVFDFVDDEEAVKRYSVDKIPAIAIVGSKDYGIRYYGVPAGYEFSSLVGTIVDVSRGESGLEPATRAAVAELGEPLHMQVFVTPT